MSNSYSDETEKSLPRRDKTLHVFEQSRDQARDAARQAASSLESNPIGLLIGGLAVGAIAAALVPRSDKERELLAPIGKRISATAVAALGAAKESGMAELAARGLTRDGARDQARQLFEGVSKAVATAGQAGIDAARRKSA